MIQKFLVCRDDGQFLAFPDVALTAGGKLVCVFLECKHPGDRSLTRVASVSSADRGRTWSAPRPVTEPLRGVPRQDPYWNCPRVTALANGRLVVVVDKLSGPDEGHGGSGARGCCLFHSKDEGQTWDGPYPTAARGVMPDRVVELKHPPHAGRWVLCAHARVGTDAGPRAQVRCWVSDDRGKTWRGPQPVNPSQPQWLAGEASVVELPGGRLACFLREMSGQGLDGLKSLSLDGGITWEGPYPAPLPGLARPVAGTLRDGRVLVTYRFLPVGSAPGTPEAPGSCQNLFAALTDGPSCLAKLRKEAKARILPIDYDRGPHADTGFSGWVQFADGEIYVVNQVVDDHPRGQIRGYSLGERDFLL